MFGQVEFDYWRKGEGIAEARKANRDQFMKVAVPFADKATFLKGEGEVVAGIRSVPTFGHSPGHMAYHLESDGKRHLFAVEAWDEKDKIAEGRHERFVVADMEKFLARAMKKGG